MPIRRPEPGHEALFRAHRRTRHLNAIAEAEAADAAYPAPAVGKTAEQAPEPTSTSEPAASARSNGVARRRRRERATPAVDEMRTIKIVVPYPAPGTSAALDTLAAEIGEDAAVRSLLRRAFDDFRRGLEAGEMPEAVPVYDETDRTVTTTRRLSHRAHETAVQHLDPARLLSDRAFARLLARRALAHFLEAERREVALLT